MPYVISKSQWRFDTLVFDRRDLQSHTFTGIRKKTDGIGFQGGVMDAEKMKDRAEATLPRLRDRLHAVVASAFEERILSGALAVGDKLPSESEIARDFGISTRSVREAMQILETKGLVRRKHGERTTVARDDVDEFLGTLATSVRQLLSNDSNYMTELMVVRRMIETDVLDLLADKPDVDLSKVEAALTEMEAAGESKDFARFTAADAAFHRALVDSADNTILSVFYDNVFALVTEVIRVTSSVPTKSYAAALAEHAEIYNKIREGNLTDAKSLMREHIESSADYLRIAIEKGNS